MVTRLEFKSLADPKHRGPLARIAIVFLASLLVLFLVFGRNVTTVGSLPHGENKLQAPPPKTVKNLVNPYKGVNANEPSPRYQRTLVVAKMSGEDTTWIDEKLSDLLAPQGDLTAAIYVVDNISAPLHVPINKGHEAMVYLTYIIDHYDRLRDVTIFMHFHEETWHNNDLLDGSSSSIVRALSSEKIVRDGYMNLRCHWEPGCPSWIHPQTDHFDDHKTEEKEISKAFIQMYPNDPLPVTLSQPCCGQFAVSRERILQLPRQRYIELRQWIEKTSLDDDISGRVFEYTWQYLFTNEPVHCHNMHLCYCDGYSVCFVDEQAYIQYLDIQDTCRAFEDDLSDWEEEEERYRKGEGEKPEEGRDKFLERNINDLSEELDRRKDAALELGSDRGAKYDILSRAWDELIDHPPGHLAEKYGHFGVDSDIV